MMTAVDVCEVLGRIEQAGLAAWIDGGWGVDALLGVQTRTHEDLDLVMLSQECAACAACLPEFPHDLDAQPGMPHRLVLMDARRRTIDIHPVVREPSGAFACIGEPRVILYPAGGLDGQGSIAGRAVRCLSASCQVAQHSGYQNHGPDDVDFHDMRALAERFPVALPAEYAERPGWVHRRRALLERR
jgi:lincosamide nucleotidyltransferase A/C/D/E